MTHPRSPAGHDATADDPTLDELAGLLPGQVRRPGDTDWDSCRSGWVTSVDQHPLAVVTVSDPTDVVTVVRWAGRHRRSVSVQPVGHGATDAVNGTVLLRTADLDQISLDPAARTVLVGAGVTWGQLLAATGKHGLTALAGSNAGPSVVGMTVGGGLSWFGRKHGLTAHSTTAFDVVDALGRLRRAPPTRTRTCSGRCAEVAGTSRSWWRWSSSSTPRRTSTAAGCSGRSGSPARCCVPSAT